MDFDNPARPSITDKVAPLELGEIALDVHASGEGFIFGLVDGTLFLTRADKRIDAHDGLVSTAGRADGIVTGGEDGKVLLTREDGTQNQVFQEKGRWIDRVTASRDGNIAFSFGKSVVATGPKLKTSALTLPSSAGGLAFAPKGVRLAIGHYGGVSLWFPGTQSAPEKLDWKGSHLAVTWSGDARFVVTAMQEPELHGWKLPEKRDMRMSGYPVKVRSLSWTHNGKFLASSGSKEAILWPFTAKNGPMGQSPMMLGPRMVLATRVAAHPASDILAIGYEDGMILLARVGDGAEILLRRQSGGAIAAMAWSLDGNSLAFATEGGEAGIARL